MPDIIEWPRAWWGVVQCEFGLMPRSRRSVSPWRMSQNVYGPHVQWWQAKLTFPAMSDANLAAREAIVESLGGSAGLVRMGHPFRLEPLYNADVAAGSQPFSDGTFFEDGSGWASGILPPLIYVVEAEAARATSVVVGGLTASTSRMLRRGDMVEFRRNGVWDETPSLHRVTRDASTDAAGETRIEITPPLRKGVAAGDQVVLNEPKSVFRLMSDEDGIATRDHRWVGSMGINLIEALI